MRLIIKQLVSDLQENLKETKMLYNKPGWGGTVQSCIVKHLRNGVSKVVCVADHPKLIPEILNMEYTDCVKFGLSHISTNLLLLPDTIKNLIYRHIYLSKQLYINSYHTYSKTIINRKRCRLLSSNYTMELSAEQWRAGQQDFHIRLLRANIVMWRHLLRN